MYLVSNHLKAAMFLINSTTNYSVNETSSHVAGSGLTTLEKTWLIVGLGVILPVLLLVCESPSHFVSGRIYLSI